MSSSSSQENKILSAANLNPNVLKAEYAVRGEVVIRASRYEQMLQDPEQKKKLSFDEILYCNIGNPQQLKQKPITFFRNVLSCVTSPELIEEEERLSGVFKTDVFQRARSIMEHGFNNGNSSSGAYTHSQGLPMVRQDVAKFIQERDQCSPIDIDNIFLTDGASPAVQLTLKALIRDGNDGIMIPIPQYPLYSATIQLHGGAQVNYYLDEKKGWGLSNEELQRSYDEAVKKGIHVRALAIINPGNPTGQILEKDDMKQVIEFCEKNRVLLLSDEVYQTNNYVDNKQWYSFNRVAHEMGKSDTLELISFHSVSKGFLGECGRRGGYMHLSNGISRDVQQQLYKLASVNLCPNVDGQIMVGLMVNPPKSGDASYEQYCQERDAILGSLKKRSQLVCDALNGLEGVTCNITEGSMYVFPQITLSAKAIDEANKRNMQPDMMYVLDLLDSTGICVVAGSGFQQYPGTFHFRTTFLPPLEKMQTFCEKISTFHRDFMKKYA